MPVTKVTDSTDCKLQYRSTVCTTQYRVYVHYPSADRWLTEVQGYHQGRAAPTCCHGAYRLMACSHWPGWPRVEKEKILNIFFKITKIQNFTGICFFTAKFWWRRTKLITVSCFNILFLRAHREDSIVWLFCACAQLVTLMQSKHQYSLSFNVTKLSCFPCSRICLKLKLIIIWLC